MLRNSLPLKKRYAKRTLKKLVKSPSNNKLLKKLSKNVTGPWSKSATDKAKIFVKPSTNQLVPPNTSRNNPVSFNDFFHLWVFIFKIHLKKKSNIGTIQSSKHATLCFSPEYLIFFKTLHCLWKMCAAAYCVTMHFQDFFSAAARRQFMGKIIGKLNCVKLSFLNGSLTKHIYDLHFLKFLSLNFCGFDPGLEAGSRR